MKLEHSEQHLRSLEGSLKKRLNVKTEFLDGFDRIKVEEPAVNSRLPLNLNSLDKLYKTRSNVGDFGSATRNESL